MDDDNIPKYTVTMYTKHGEEIFPNTTEVDTNDRQLTFVDKNGKSHEFFNVDYHIQSE